MDANLRRNLTEQLQLVEVKRLMELKSNHHHGKISDGLDKTVEEIKAMYDAVCGFRFELAETRVRLQQMKREN